jgi:hypothetical protein
MRHQRFHLVTVVLAATVILTACPRHVSAPRLPQTLVSPTRDLTRALRAEIRYGATGVPPTDDALLQSVFARKLALARAFQGLPVKLKRGTREVVVSVCTPDGKNASLEDASWTPMVVDHTWYKAGQPRPCSFDPTLDPDSSPLTAKELLGREWSPVGVADLAICQFSKRLELDH